ncbi:MAG: 4-hydroxythreonine-4-phosphate dehydrogenase PdxA [Saprospiraceae bacterium]|nr:4-hydroxythreonine-4-phosphate dehydrogenase PdxA [Saprospiraceae bacterium]
MEKLKIGISVGDINGIGLEVILKTVSIKKILDYCVPVIYGSSKVVSYHKNIVNIDFQFNSTRSAQHLQDDKVNIVNCWNDNVNITLGKPTETGGAYAYKALEEAVKELQHGLIDALVTAPINKHAMQMANFPFPGHTEYLTQELGEGKKSLMLMVSETLKVGLVTNHLPIREVAEAITKELILEKIQILNESLKVDFGIERPTIAILGLNPHAGDEGVLGNEEEELIRPAIVAAKEQGILAMGPFPADGLFGSGQYKKFDAILAMYHDQGLVPFKALSFGSGVNFTAGLGYVRSSPDHGTAYDIAGQNQADPASFREALFLALDVARNRRDYAAAHANPLVRREHKREEEGAETEETIEENGE